MIKRFVLPLCLGLSLTGAAQQFPGFRSGNYTGVNGAFFNPANIADSRYRFDINLFAFHTGVGNNQASFKLRNIGNSFNVDSLKDQVFSGNAGLTSALVNADIHGPSVMFNAGSMSFALTTRVRAVANITDMDGRLLGQLSDDLNPNTTLPYTISSNADMRVTANAWSEIGLSAARVLVSKGPHFLKGGLTLKYLMGGGNANINVVRLNTTIDEDLAGEEYLENSTGTISTTFGGADLDDLDGLPENNSTGFGGDVGFVYEYRPRGNNYQFRAGLALLDVGSISYKRDADRSGGYTVDITGAERFYLNQFSGKDIDEYNSVLKANPQYFTPVGNATEGEYKVSLPTSLQLDLDYAFSRHFFTSLAAQVPVVGNDAVNPKVYASYTLTPRFETGNFSAYLPLNTNSLTKFNAGIALRAGPLFVGSGSVISSLLGSSKQADFYMGIHIGFRKK